MRSRRITASISVLNGQQGFPAAVLAPQWVRARHSIVHLDSYATCDEFANAAERVPAATLKQHASCQRDVEQTPSEWGASTINKVMKPASRRRMDRGVSARGVKATRSGAITGQQMRRIGGS